MPPSRWCSSRVSRPPLKACLLILVWGWCVSGGLGEEGGKAYLDLIRRVGHEDCGTDKLCKSLVCVNRKGGFYLGSLALIFPPAPCNAVRNFEWINAGFGDGKRIRCELSRTRRKYGS
jgi:hypothetical protein